MDCCKLCRWHETPLNATLHIFGFVFLLLGVYYHSWDIILSAILVFIIGHITQFLLQRIRKKERVRKK